MSPKLICRLLPVVFLAALSGFAAKYSGPRPPKPDVPYLVHADNLISTEIGDAKEDRKKNDTVYSVPGTSSPARTPLSEPIFLMETKNLSADRLTLYRMEVKNGRREVIMSQTQKRTGKGRALRLAVTRVDDNLYRVEVDENLGLENGQYCLTPEGSNQVFCFEVY
jgi:hypothetical protein